MQDDQAPAADRAARRSPWNKGKLVGAKPPLRPSHVWSIRTKLHREGRKRDLALFNLAVDSKLRSCDVVAIRVDDVAPSGYAMDRATIRQRKTGRPVRFELTDQTRMAIDEYLRLTGRKPGQLLFAGVTDTSGPSLNSDFDEVARPMPNHNADNERIKRAYFLYLKEARRLSEDSVDAAAAAISRFERYTRYRDFKKFRTEQAVAFKRKLAQEVGTQTGAPLSRQTLFATLNALRSFFHWLAGQPGYRSRLSYGDADFFNLSEKETRIAKASPEKRVPSLEQILHVVDAMPAGNAIELRNRALIAFTLLTGIRDGAMASLKLKHIDLEDGKVVQDAREVKTKFSKTFTTWFFPVGEEVRQIFVDWIGFLTQDLLFGPDDPLFPATRVYQGDDHQFQAAGLASAHWSNATPIRVIFKDAFLRAGLPYFNPHTFPRTLAQLGERACRTPEEFKAWSQNLGHESVLTTFSSYGEVARTRQAELIRRLGRSAAGEPNYESKIDQAVRLLEEAKRLS